MEYIDAAERALGMSQEPYGLALHELTQAEETGHDVSALRARFAELDPGDEAGLLAVYEQLPVDPPADSPFFERSELDAIVAELPEAERAPAPAGAALEARMRGAWLGRVAGNMLGKPVEMGWPRGRLKAYLSEHDAYPLRDYVPIDPDPGRAAAQGFDAGFVPYGRLARGRIDGGVRDDDLDYTILALHLLESYGTGFTSYDVAVEWLHRFPLYQLYTAERAAYNNLVREVPLDRAGGFRNPFREWIGALIRADVFGFVSPGDPRRAALLAHKDAWLSHRANGIYGEMWAAALIATAFTAASPAESVRQSLQHVPARSRLAAEIRAVLADREAGLDWEAALDRLDARHPRMSWVHTINNAGALTAALLWGDGDFGATIGLAVQAGLDTDSIGATAGAWAGAFLGEAGIPEHWTAPLHDRTESALFGFGSVSLSDVAARTLRLASV